MLRYVTFLTSPMSPSPEDALIRVTHATMARHAIALPLWLEDDI